MPKKAKKAKHEDGRKHRGALGNAAHKIGEFVKSLRNDGIPHPAPLSKAMQGNLNSVADRVDQLGKMQLNPDDPFVTGNMESLRSDLVADLGALLGTDEAANDQQLSGTLQAWHD